MARWLARAMYIAVCGAIAWHAWSAWSDALVQYRNEKLATATILIYGLTLPISMLVGLLYAGFAALAPIDRLDFGSPIVNWLIETWAPLAIAGYVQWFVVSPWLTRKWRSRRNGAIPS